MTWTRRSWTRAERARSIKGLARIRQLIAGQRGMAAWAAPAWSAAAAPAVETPPGGRPGAPPERGRASSTALSARDLHASAGCGGAEHRDGLNRGLG